jgi:biopolymer transport protein ExbB
MNFFDEVVAFLITGGLIMVPLSATAFGLWYAIGARWAYLKRHGSIRPRDVVGQIKSQKLPTDSRDPVISATARALASLDTYQHPDEQSYFIQEAFAEATVRASKYRKIVTTLVVIAPLLGLLGTVVGMIEAFEAITNSTSQDTSTGISGGIAKALFATQMGLIIAIPGMIFGSFLNKRERKIVDELRQIKSLIATHLYGPVAES